MSSRRTIGLLSVTVMASALGATALVGEEVSVSRYRRTVVSAGAAVLQNVDQTAVDSLCRDEDGCEVILRQMQGVNVWAVNTQRLFLSSLSPNEWSAIGDPGHTDANGGANPVLTVSTALVPGSSCQFTDDDETGGADTDVGFGLVATQADCVLTLID